MNKKNVILFYLFALNFFALKSETLAHYLSKYNLPENINVLSVFSEDCVNCYYGFSYFLKEHQTDFKKEKFVFLFQKAAEKEIDNIFKYRLGLEKAGYKIIVDDAFYVLVCKSGVTTLSIIEKESIVEQYTSKDIYKYKNFVNRKMDTSAFELIELDTIDLMGRFGTKKLSIAILNESKIVIQNKYTSTLFLYDIKTKHVVKKLPISIFTEKYDSLLKLLVLDNPQSLDYNLKNYRDNTFYKSFPLCSIQKAYCYDNFVYLCLSVAQMEIDTSGHVVHGSQLAMVKLDSNLQTLYIHKVPEKVPDSDKHLSFFDCVFIDSDIAIVSLSFSNNSDSGKKDSVCALYSLKTSEIKVLNLSYEFFMPKRGNNGYHNYYHFNAWKENGVLKSYFNRSPYVYNLSDNSKHLIPEIGVNPNTIEISEKDKFFWISKIFLYKNSALVIVNKKQNETSLHQYDSEIKKLIASKKIYDFYFSYVFVLRNNLFAFENYSEKGDVATMHIYTIK